MPERIEGTERSWSQINGCAYCIDMHTKDAGAHGQIEQRLYALTAWREAPFFTDWGVLEPARDQFSEGARDVPAREALSTRGDGFDPDWTT